MSHSTIHCESSPSRHPDAGPTPNDTAFSQALQSGTVLPKVNIDPERPEQGLVKLVLAVVELVRRLLEGQAIRRMEAGGLTDAEVDRLGTTLMNLENKIRELQVEFGIDSLNINLGPLGDLFE